MIAICSVGLRGGRSDTAVRANMVLPVPGGPESNKLWWPAIAIISARLA